VAKLIYNKCSVSFKLNEFNYLLVTTIRKPISEIQLARNDNVLRHSGDGAEAFVKPGPEAYKYFPYYVLFDEINVIMQPCMSAG
jgi:hypothetical protein